MTGVGIVLRSVADEAEGGARGDGEGVIVRSCLVSRRSRCGGV
jgi:hypothetical protein